LDAMESLRRSNLKTTSRVKNPGPGITPGGRLLTGPPANPFNGQYYAIQIHKRYP